MAQTKLSPSSAVSTPAESTSVPTAKKRAAKKKKPSMSKTRTDIITAMMSDTIEGDLTSRAQAERILDSAINAIVKFINEDERVFINHFGTFQRVTVKGRKLKTPDGKSMVTKNKVKISFKASKMIMQDLNS